MGLLLRVSWGFPPRALTVSELPDRGSLKIVWITLILAIFFDMLLETHFNYKINAHILGTWNRLTAVRGKEGGKNSERKRKGLVKG